MEVSPIYIIGHKNPDADSICSAIAYADLKEKLGYTNYIAARCGNINIRIRTILEHFNVPVPHFIGDVTPRLHDIMIPVEKVALLKPQSTYAEALSVMDDLDIRSLPVVDESNTLLGQISIFQMGEHFIPTPKKPKEMRWVNTSVHFLTKALEANVYHTVNEMRMEPLFILVGVMSIEAFMNFQSREGKPEESIVVVGNREDIQEKAIELGVRLLVITGRHLPSEKIIKKAKEKNVSLISSAFEVPATTWIIRSATPIQPIIQKDIVCFKADEKLSDTKRRISTHIASIYFIVDEMHHLVGIFTKSDILKPVKTELVLVDHNEMSQAVNGADEVRIAEIIDHHRLGNPPTYKPIRFVNEPWGSTCTIIAKMFQTAKITPSPAIAGIMMGGVITDTLNLNSPTTTNVDREILPWLSSIAGISANELAEIIFNSGSIILSSEPRKVIESDCKVYKQSNQKFSISQIEELGFDNFWKHMEALSEALEAYCKKENLSFSLLLVTDINTQNSLLLVTGDKSFIDHMTYPQVENYPIFELEGIVSRKKQLVPYISSLINDNQTESLLQ